MGEQIRASERPTCGAKRRSGGACRSTAVMRNGRCAVHGGKSLSGPRHPNWKHGRRSKYRLPDRLQAAFVRSVDDPDLTSHRSELALTDAMTNDVLGELDGVDRATWPMLVKSIGALTTAVESGELEAITAAAEQLQQLVKSGARHAAVIKSIVNMLEKRSRIAAREHRRMVDLDVMVRYDEFLARIVLMMGSVREFVNDPAIVANIAASWEKCLGPLPDVAQSQSVLTTGEG